MHSWSISVRSLKFGVTFAKTRNLRKDTTLFLHEKQDIMLEMHQINLLRLLDYAYLVNLDAISQI